MDLSSNQMAQEDRDTGANEVHRIRSREHAVNQSWRSFVYDNSRNPTAKELSYLASELIDEDLGEEFVIRICERNGNRLGRLVR